ncbi:MazG nucleotide pyrophosphohydrolase domain-containing protein [Corynebacterium gerontici]|nr:MazG nucleotide pyrophosphohydrolase domain-containing protein [Corynebacterium gerontici]
MTVLLLDARWPTLIPFDFISSLRGTVTYTDEVPVQVRWDFGDCVKPGSETLLVSTDERNEQVLAAQQRGERVLEVPSRHESLGQAMRTMERALRLGEWEQLQTHQSLLAYLDEEAAEFREAVENNVSDQELCDELADLLLQVLFHAEIADRRGAFNINDVAAAFVDKMQKRAPYLFDGTTEVVDTDEQMRLWEAGKLL